MLFLLLLAALPPAEVLQMLNRAVEVHGAVISRDGARVAWVEQESTPDGPSWERSTVFVQDLASSAPVRVAGGADDGDLAFSPDGSSLAFLSDAEKPHQPQLWVADLRGGQARQLTHLDGHLQTPRFSPDGKSIAVLFIEGGADLRGPLQPSARAVGVVDEQVKEQRIAVVPLDGTAPLKAISPPDLFVYEYAWRPDGRAFAATAAHGSGDDNWWIAQLYLIEAGGAARLVHQPKLQICEPSWSPDGASIAFIEGLMSDHGSNGGDLFVVPADASAKARDLTPRLRASVSSVRWVNPHDLLVKLAVEGDTAFASVSAAGGAPRILWRGPMFVPNDWSVAADGYTIATLRDSFTEPPEIVAGTIGAWRQVTRRNAELHSPIGEARSIRWKSDKFDVQGWLLSPPAPPSGKAPMVVLAHGGPAGLVYSVWLDQALLLASQGYYVFLPNFRGSFGQGEEFTRANVKDFGYGDLRDIQRGIDAVLKQAPVDPARIGLFGHSYGGYMAMWIVTQTRRFKAAVASAGIVNWQSYYGQNRIDQWMLPYFGKSVYDDPAVYARSSPITFIRKVKTPTLVLHGERDAEVPLPQGEEFWHALKTLGVETQFVVYENEGHRIRQPAHVRDRMQRIVDWFNRHL